MDKQLIYDVGMCDGSDTAHYLSKGFRVVSIEANPVLAERGKRLFNAAIKSGQLTILNIGIAERTGQMPFYVNERRAEWSSFVKEIGCRDGTPCHSITVNCNRMEDVLKEYGVPYYLKIDIEGHDHLCLLGISPSDPPPYLSCEAVHPEWLDILKDKGYQKFKLINQADGFKAVDLSRERLAFRDTFLKVSNGIKKRWQKRFAVKYPYNSSGPFAEETDGEWKSHEEIRQLLIDFETGNHGGRINQVSWFDFHAWVG